MRPTIVIVIAPYVSTIGPRTLYRANVMVGTQSITPVSAYELHEALDWARGAVEHELQLWESVHVPRPKSPRKEADHA